MKRVLRLAARYFSTKPIDQISAQDLEVFFEFELKTTQSATLNRRLSSLNRFFEWSTHQQLCGTNPLAKRESRPLSRRLPRPIRSQADLRLIDSTSASAAQPYRLIFTILRETGMRVGEVLALSLGDVVLESGQEGLRVREPKNHHERIVILGPDATPRTLRALRGWLRDRKSQPVHNPLLISNRGTRLSYAAVQYQWERLCQRAGLVEADGSLRYTLHQLRHTRGSELVRQGLRLEIVQRVLGHTDIRSTQGYAELDDLQVREALAAASHH